MRGLEAAIGEVAAAHDALDEVDAPGTRGMPLADRIRALVVDPRPTTERR
jgi:hypothetical protein